MSVVDLLARAVEGRDPDAPALWSPGGTLTLGDLARAVDGRAEALAGEGAAPGAVRPVVLEPDRDGVITLLALWRLGITPAPLNPRLTRAERAAAEAALAEVEPGAQAVLWTSGTSGRPRGVALGHDGIRANTLAVADRLGLDGSEVWLASLSLAHVGGLVLVARALLTGAPLVAAGPWDPGTVAAAVDPERLPPWLPRPASHLSLVPTQLDRLLARWGERPPPPSLRCVLIGGAHAPVELVRAAAGAGWPLALTYGMTEMTSQVATAPPPEVRRNPVGVGRPLSGVELRVDAAGEILVRGPALALAYVGPGAGPLTDEEGWYHTGDLGALDPDGVLRVTGRRSDRIVSGGVNVDPVEVEDALRAHPAVVDAAVVGIPSREWGETVAAAVVPVWGVFDLPEVEHFARGCLSGPKRPRAWKVEAELPRNPNGKVDREAVRRLFEPA